MPQTITAKIESVSDLKREWKGDRGTLIFLQGTFSDGSGWSFGCKPENADARLAEMKALLEKEGQFEVEPKQDYEGVKQWKLLSWPGKPQPGQGGGGGGRGGREFVPRYIDTKEGYAEQRQSISRSVALQQAVALLQVGQLVTPQAVLECADDFYGWLMAVVPDQPQATQELPSQPAPQQQQLPLKPVEEVTREKSVYEKAVEYIGKCDSLDELLKIAQKVADRKSEKLLGAVDYKDLNHRLAQRAIDICKSEKDYDISEKFILDLKKAMRLTEADFTQFSFKHADQKQAFLGKVALQESNF